MLVTNKKIPLERIRYFHTVLAVLSDIGIFLLALQTVFTIIRDFFLVQSRLRPRFMRPPCVLLDHPCDQNIPFAPGWAREYLGFIRLWVTGITWLRIHFGTAGIEPMKRSLRDIITMYRTASSVYRQCQSTTSRPARIKGNRYLALIHATDPHLNCLPSLHVMVVSWAGYTLAGRIQKPGSGVMEEEAVAHIRHHARLITETTLYMKQHSVNCIPAALFVMRELFPGCQTAYGESFLASLFQDTVPEVKDRHEIAGCMITLYRYFLHRRAASPDTECTQILVEYLRSYLADENYDSACTAEGVV